MGGQGKLAKNYIDIAKDTITNVWEQRNLRLQVLKPCPLPIRRPSTFLFCPPITSCSKIDTKTQHWTTTVDTMYTSQRLAEFQQWEYRQCLVPAWCDSSGKRTEVPC